MAHMEVWVFYVTVVVLGGTGMTNASLSHLQTQLFRYQICSHLCHKTAGCRNFTYVSSNRSCYIQGPNISLSDEKEKRNFNISKERRSKTGNGDQTCPLNLLLIKSRNYQEPSYERKRVLKVCMKNDNETLTMRTVVSDHCHKLYKSCDEGLMEQAFKHFSRLSSPKLGEVTSRRGHRTFDFFIDKKNCNLSRVVYRNYTILHLAVKWHFPNLVQCVIAKNRIPVDTRGWRNRTALMTAALTGNLELFNLLQQCQCDLSGVDSDGSNILHLACRGGNPDIVKILLKRVKKTTLKERNNNGKTPLELVEKRHKKKFGFLRKILNS